MLPIVLLLLLFTHSVMSDSLLPHGLRHTRPPCPSPAPGVCLHSCPLSRWCHPTISSPVIHFSSCLQSFPASGSFPVSQLFASGGQSIGASASASVLPMNIQGWIPDWLVWSPCISRDSQEPALTPQFKKINSLALSLLFGPIYFIFFIPLNTTWNYINCLFIFTFGLVVFTYTFIICLPHKLICFSFCLVFTKQEGLFFFLVDELWILDLRLQLFFPYWTQKMCAL